MIGRVLITANCHVKPTSLLVHVNRLPQGYLRTHTRITSHSSLQLLSTLTCPEYCNSQQHRHTSTALLPHPTGSVRHPGRISPPCLSVCWRHASSIGSPPEEGGGEPGWLKQRWIKFKTIIKAFVAGSKALYGDVKKMRQIQSKLKGQKVVLGRPPNDASSGQVDFPLTREELFFVTKVRG